MDIRKYLPAWAGGFKSKQDDKRPNIGETSGVTQTPNEGNGQYLLSIRDVRTDGVYRVRVLGDRVGLKSYTAKERSRASVKPQDILLTREQLYSVCLRLKEDANIKRGVVLHYDPKKLRPMIARGLARKKGLELKASEVIKLNEKDIATDSEPKGTGSRSNVEYEVAKLLQDNTSPDDLSGEIQIQ